MNRWHEITEETYWQIFRELVEEFTVFATITNLGEPMMPDLPRMILTEWGFKGQDFPLIKSVVTETDKKFYIIKAGSFV